MTSGPVRRAWRSAAAPLLLIAGPCVIESEAHALGLALRDPRHRRAAPACPTSSRPRTTRPTAPRSARSAGPGSSEGLRILARVREDAGVPILTDIHEPAQAAPVAEVADVLQIPAFLCAPDRPAGRRGADRPGRQHQEGTVPRAGRHAPRRSRRSRRPATRSVIVTERGFSFGYNNLVVDMRAFPILRALGYPGRLRRHPQPAAAGRRRRRHRRPGGVHRADGVRPAWPPASTACSWKSTSGPTGQERRAERAAARPARAAARPAGRAIHAIATAPR